MTLADVIEKWDLELKANATELREKVSARLARLSKEIERLEAENAGLRGEGAALRISTDELRRLCNDVDGVINNLNPQDFRGAINWGDLGCAQVLRVFDEDHRSWLRVVIEEASEGETQLIEAVRKGLEERGWTDLEIETQW